jgi:hypothetical protein
LLHLSSPTWQLIKWPTPTWLYWISVSVAAAGIAWCAWAALRSTHSHAGRWAYLAAIICAAPLALNWPLAKLLNFVLPKVF